MGIFDNVKFVKPHPRGKDPVIVRRDTFVRNIQKQIDVLDGQERQCKPWHDKYAGKLRSTIRFANSPIDLKDGQKHFEVSNADELKDIYQNVLEQVNDGKWDAKLTEHSKAKGKGKKVA